MYTLCVYARILLNIDLESKYELSTACALQDFFIHVLNRKYKDIKSLPELQSFKVHPKHPACTILLLLHHIYGTFGLNTAGKVFDPLKAHVNVWSIKSTGVQAKCASRVIQYTINGLFK